MRIEHDDRIGFVGANGSGKTSLLRILAGVEASTAGQIFVAQNVRRGYLPKTHPQRATRPCTKTCTKTFFAALLRQGEDLRQLEARMTDPATSEAELHHIWPITATSRTPSSGQAATRLISGSKVFSPAWAWKKNFGTNPWPT